MVVWRSPPPSWALTARKLGCQDGRVLLVLPYTICVWTSSPSWQQPSSRWKEEAVLSPGVMQTLWPAESPLKPKGRKWVFPLPVHSYSECPHGLLLPLSPCVTSWLPYGASIHAAPFLPSPMISIFIVSNSHCSVGSSYKYVFNCYF